MAAIGLEHVKKAVMKAQPPMQNLRAFVWLLVAWLPGAVVFGAEPPANFVTNPGFETGTTPWLARGPASLLVNAPGHTGGSSALLTSRGSTSSAVAQSGS